MDVEEFLTKLRKHLRDKYQQVGELMVAGGVDNMEKYKYLLGQARVYKEIDQEISNLLNPKEQKNERNKKQDNIINFGETRDS
jgi:hypothetical protein|tara:strand:+ start:253 stop:501 length:249 start_codon:yes stop_codon:yes gene_type:complete